MAVDPSNARPGGETASAGSAGVGSGGSSGRPLSADRLVLIPTLPCYETGWKIVVVLVNSISQGDPLVARRSPTKGSAGAEDRQLRKYVLINPKALDEQIDKDWVAQYPQFTTAVDQLHALPRSAASAGCLLGVMPQARKASEGGLESAIVGSKPAEQAMKDAAASVQGAIDSYIKLVS